MGGMRLALEIGPVCRETEWEWFFFLFLSKTICYWTYSELKLAYI